MYNVYGSLTRDPPWSKYIIAFDIVLCIYVFIYIGRLHVFNTYTIHVYCIVMCDLIHIKQ